LSVQGGVILRFHACAYLTLIRLSPSITYSFSITLIPYYSSAYSALCYIIFIYSQIVFQYSSPPLFSFPLPPTSSPWDRSTNTIMCSLSLSHIYYISQRSKFHIRQKTGDICPSDPGLLCLIGWSPVPSIDLQRTKFHFSLWLNNKYSMCPYIPHLLNPFISCKESGLFSKLGYCE
jgi:hypothetical protein